MRIFILFLTFLISIPSQAQQNDNKPKWAINKYHIGFGFDVNRYDDINLTDILTYAKRPELMVRNLEQFSPEASLNAIGGALVVNVSVSPYSKSKGSYLNQHEFRMGVEFHSPKESMLSFKNPGLDTSIVYCNLHGAFALDAAYLYNGSWGNFVNWFVGIGGNTAASLGSEMVLMSGRYFEEGEHPSSQEVLTEERFEGKPVMYFKGYIPFGLHFRLTDKLSLGFENRIGGGIQKISGEASRRMKSTNTFLIGCKFRV